eukprot:754935-Hanusia_phi.AAC.1
MAVLFPRKLCSVAVHVDGCTAAVCCTTPPKWLGPAQEVKGKVGEALNMAGELQVELIIPNASIAPEMSAVGKRVGTWGWREKGSWGRRSTEEGGREEGSRM